MFRICHLNFSENFAAKVCRWTYQLADSKLLSNLIELSLFEELEDFPDLVDPDQLRLQRLIDHGLLVEEANDEFDFGTKCYQVIPLHILQN